MQERCGSVSVWLLLPVLACSGRASEVPDVAADRGGEEARTPVAPEDTSVRPDLPECPFVVSGDDLGVRRWSTVTLRADPGWQVGNPFDPAEVRVDGEFAAPDGSLRTVPGFYYQPFSRSLVDGTEVVTPAGDPDWRVRFTPRSDGVWHWRWVATVDGVTCATDWRFLLVVEPEASDHGFVRVGKDAGYFAFDDGTRYFPVGENMAWPDARGTYAFDEWMERLAAHGGNYVRIWMASWSHALEWVVYGPDGRVLATTLGDYTHNMDRAWKLDRIFESAHAHGIHIMLCLLHHGQFSEEVNPVWQWNPYSSRLGGPLKKPSEFFTNASARKLFERRLRYMVARWSHATELMAWELWNEVDYTQVYDGAILAEWHAHMAGLLHALDPNDHLVTTSTSMVGSLLGLDEALYSLPGMDFSQFHLYGSGTDLDLDLVSAIPGVAAGLAALGKPVLAGEVGVDYRGPAETLAVDPRLTGFRDILWIPVLAGTAGTGMHWWWDSVVDPLDLYPQFAPVAQAVDGVDFAAEQFAPDSWTQEIDGRKVQVLRLSGKSVCLLWIKDAADPYFAPLDPIPLGGLSLSLAGMSAGEWNVTWLDPPGEVESTVGAWNGVDPLAVPTFVSSVVARMDRK